MPIMRRAPLFPPPVPAGPVLEVQIVAAWFLFTLACGIWAARTRKLRSHRRWMLRHAAAGLWVAVQRVLMVCAEILGMTGVVPTPKTEGGRTVCFGTASTVAVIITLVGCELFLLHEARTQRTAAQGKEQ